MIAHVAGVPVAVRTSHGQLCYRLRCAWCGAILVDARPADEHGEVPFCPPGLFVKLDDEGDLVKLADEFPYPDDACTAIDPTATR